VSSWIPHHARVGRDILCYHGSGSHKAVFSKGYATNNGSVGPDGGAPFDPCGSKLVFSSDKASGVENVGKNARGAAENVVLKRNAFIETDVVLDFASVADDDIRLHHDILAYNTIFSYLGAPHEVTKMPHLGPFTQEHTWIYIRRGVHVNSF
jgi:hypothetical protein